MKCDIKLQTKGQFDTCVSGGVLINPCLVPTRTHWYGLFFTLIALKSTNHSRVTFSCIILQYEISSMFHIRFGCQPENIKFSAVATRICLWRAKILNKENVRQSITFAGHNSVCVCRFVSVIACICICKFRTFHFRYIF